MAEPLILLTGFEPFADRARNPSAELVRRLTRQPPPGMRLEGLILPVDAEEAVGVLLGTVDQMGPQAVACTGEAAGRPAISLEQVAVNLLAFDIPDNAGHRPQGEPVMPGGPAAYMATWPLREMQAAMREAGVPAVISLSAGAYLCNQVMYALLHHLAGREPPVPAGFAHLPALPEEEAARDRPKPTMSLDTAARGMRAALRVLASGIGGPG